MKEKQDVQEKVTPLSKKLSVDGNIHMKYNNKGTGIIVSKDFLISAESGKVVINKGDKNSGWKSVVIPKGNVGIGTDTPGEKLTVKTAIDKHGLVHTNGTQLVSTYLSNKGGHVGTKSNHDFHMRSNGIDRLSITKTGDINVGAVNSESKFTMTTGTNIYGLIQKTGDVEVGTYTNDKLGGFGTKSNSRLLFIVNDQYKALIGTNGNMRIGRGTKETDKAKLVIDGAGNKRGIGEEYKLFVTLDLKRVNTYGKGSDGKGSYFEWTRKWDSKYSIHATDVIGAPQIKIFSDQRIKNIKGISNSKNDLKILSGIEISDYQHIDVVGKGRALHKKVIAQQVKTVFPQAVSDDIEDFIPNVYAKTKIEKGWIHLEADVEVNDRVKLIFSDGVKELKVLEKTKDAFKVNADLEGEVFVYGKEVKDYHTVDYDAISMLNVSATQELLKRIESLEQEVKKLKTSNETNRK